MNRPLLIYLEVLDNCYLLKYLCNNIFLFFELHFFFNKIYKCVMAITVVIKKTKM